MQDYKKLEIWKEAHQLTLDIYGITSKFPKDELYSITNQIRRATVSIPTNIAEGCGRKSDKEFLQFLSIAVGSTNEVDYLLLLSKDLSFISIDEHEKLSSKTEKLRKRTLTLISKIKEKINS